MRDGEPLPVKSANRSSLRLEGQGKSTRYCGDSGRENAAGYTENGQVDLIACLPVEDGIN